uniref:Uncharacterized protein n=1 Tax=Anguilla anguilla TaxID=7936 RepID=A0A0E9VU07_ANGAN
MPALPFISSYFTIMFWVILMPPPFPDKNTTLFSEKKYFILHKRSTRKTVLRKRIQRKLIDNRPTFTVP